MVKLLVQWNLDFTKCQGTGEINSLYLGFDISETSIKRICRKCSLYRGMVNPFFCFVLFCFGFFLGGGRECDVVLTIIVGSERLL